MVTEQPSRDDTKLFTFDVKMFATVHVAADNEDQARKRLKDFAGWDDMGQVDEHITVSACYRDDSTPDLVEVQPPVNRQPATPPATLHLECGAEVPHAVGTRVFNYYDMLPGVIEKTATYPDHPTMPVHNRDGGAAWWVRVRHDDGSTAYLDQSRLCSIEHARSRGWLAATEATTATVTLRIENHYAGGPVVVTTATPTIPLPPNESDKAAFEDWKDEHIFSETGTGRTEGDAAYFVEIVGSTVRELVGMRFEFGI